MTLPIKRRNLIIIIVVIVAAAVVVGGIFGFNAYKKAKEKEYFSNMSDISYEMLSSAAEAETAAVPDKIAAAAAAVINLFISMLPFPVF